MKEFILIMQEGSEDRDYNCLALCQHKDNTVAFFFNHNEVSRETSKNGEDIIHVLNISNGSDSFWLQKVKTQKQKNESSLAKSKSNQVQSEEKPEQIKHRKHEALFAGEELKQEDVENEQPPVTKDNTEIIQVKFSWKNKMGLSQSREVEYFEVEELQEDYWATKSHQRAAGYFKLYVEFMQWQNRFIVAHRNFVSVYNFVLDRWEDTFSFEDWVSNISLAKRNKKETPWYLTGTKYAEEAWKLLKKDKQPKNEEKDKQQKNEKKDKQQKNEEEDKQQKNEEEDKQQKNEEKDKHRMLHLFHKEDILQVYVFVGNQVKTIQGLHFDMFEDEVRELPPIKEDAHDFHVENYSILQISNDIENFEGVFMLLQKQEPAEIMQKVKDEKPHMVYNFQPKNGGAVILACLFMGQIQVVATEAMMKQKDEFELNDKCQIYVFKGSDPEVTMQDLDREIETRNACTQVMLSNNQQRTSRIIQLKKWRTFSCLDYDIQHPQILDGKQTEEADSLIGVAQVHTEKYKDNRYSLIRITTNSISVYDKEGDFQICFYNMNIKKTVYIDDQFLYCIDGQRNKAIKQCSVLNINGLNSKDVQCIKQNVGLGIIDVYQLVRFGKVEQHSIMKVPEVSILSQCDDKQMVSYTRDFHKASIVAYLHRCTTNFIGMDIKTDYLIWRETEMYFTALHRKGYMQTWSLCTGKLLDVKDNQIAGDYKDYLVYSTGKGDQAWLQDFYKLKDFSVSLLKKVTPETSENVYQKLPQKETQKVKKERSCWEGISCLNSLICCDKDQSLEDEKPRKEKEQTDFRFEQCFEKSVEAKVVSKTDDMEFFNFKVLIMYQKNKADAAQTEKDSKEEKGPEEADKPLNQTKTQLEEQQEFLELYSFVFPLDKTNNKKRLFLSDDLNKLLVIDEDTQSALIYEMDRPNAKKLKDELKKDKHWCEEKFHQRKSIGQVEWDLITVVHPFPQIMQGTCSANFIFSKDFEYMLDIDVKEKIFMISRLRRNVVKSLFSVDRAPIIETSGSHSQHDWELDKNFLDMSSLKQTRPQDAQITEIAKRFRWLDKKTDKNCFEVVDDQGVSLYVELNDEIFKCEEEKTKLIELMEEEKPIDDSLPKDKLKQYFKEQQNSDFNSSSWPKSRNQVEQYLLWRIEKKYEDQRKEQEDYKNEQEKIRQGNCCKAGFSSLAVSKPKKQEFSVFSQSKCDNMKEEALEKYHHFTLERKEADKQNVVHALIHRFMDITCDQYHNKNLSEADKKSKKDQKVDKEKKRTDQFKAHLDCMFACDYLPSSDETKPDEFELLRSFTVVNWKVVERLLRQGQGYYSLEEIDQMQRIQICFNLFPSGNTVFHELVNDSSEGVQNDKIMDGLFKAAKKGFDFDLEEFEAGSSFEVPIITDAYGLTAIHNALAMQPKYPPPKKETNADQDKKGEKNNKNKSFAAIMFSHLKDYSLFHHGPHVDDAIIKAVEEDVPGIADYINARLIRVNRIGQFQREFEAKRRWDFFSSDLVFKSIGVSAHINEKDVKNQLFGEDDDKDSTRGRIDQRMMDIPCVQNNDSQGRQFIQALEVVNANAQAHPLFRTEAVQLIIEHQWGKVRRFFWTYFVIYLFYAGLLTYWSVIALDDLSDALTKQIDCQDRRLLSSHFEPGFNTGVGDETLIDVSPALVNPDTSTQIEAKDPEEESEIEDNIVEYIKTDCNLDMDISSLNIPNGFRIMTIILIILASIDESAYLLARINDIVRLCRDEKLGMILEQARWQPQNWVRNFLNIATVWNCVRVLRLTLQIELEYSEQHLTFVDETGVTIEKIFAPVKMLDTLFWCVQAAVMICMLSRLLYLSRPIPVISYQIQMIFASIFAIIPFLILLGIIMFALGVTFFMISKNWAGNDTLNELNNQFTNKDGSKKEVELEAIANYDQNLRDLIPEDQLLEAFKGITNAIGYVFKFAYGPPETGGLDWIGLVTHVLTWILINVLMLNDLIAIIGSVYEIKSAQKTEEYYVSLVGLINETHSLIPKESESRSVEERYMFVVKPVTATNQVTGEDETDSDILLRRTGEIQKLLEDIFVKQTEQAEEAERVKIAYQIEAQKNLEVNKKTRGGMGQLDFIEDCLKKLTQWKTENVERKPYWQQFLKPEDVELIARNMDLPLDFINKDNAQQEESPEDGNDPRQ